MKVKFIDAISPEVAEIARRAHLHKFLSHCASRLIVPRIGPTWPGGDEPSEPHHSGLPTSAGALARLAAEEACAAGVELDPLLKASGLTAAQIEDRNERIEVEEQITFVEAVADALVRDRLGFELAQDFDLREIGLLYYVAASSETLIEAVQRIERFSAVANEAVVFRCSKAADMESCVLC